MNPEEASRPTQLAALDFARDIERLTAGFTGREWVFAAVDRWLADPDGSRFFILTGEPGAGKSAIAARLAQTQPRVVAHHFCIAGRNATITPGAALRSLAAQLGENLPGYGEALANTINPTHLSVRVDIHVDQLNGGQIVGVIIEHLHAADPQQDLDILLRAPLAALRSPPPMALILIDALDEAVTFRGDPNLAVLLADADDLPPWVRFFCTTRPERRALRYFDAVQPYLLATETEMNLADIRQFIAGRLAGPEFAPRLDDSRVPAPALTEHLVKLSSGNFLYTRVLLDDIAAGRQSLDDLDALPRSLDQIFHGFLSRFTVQEWNDCYRPILGVLAVAAQPLTEDQLSNFTGLGPTRTRQSLGVVGQFLDIGVTGQGQKAFGLFHRSLQDYLLDEKRSGDFWCAAEDGHRCIADYYLANFRDSWDGCDDYGLRYLVEHLHALRRRPADRKLLFETIGPAYMRAKRARYGSHQPFAEDVSLAIAAAQEARDLVQEIRCGLIYSTLTELATSVPPGLLAALAWTGQTEQARSLVGLRQPADQVPAYGAIGAGLLRREARQEAQDTLLQGLAVAGELADEGKRASSLAELARPFADAGMTGQLLEATRVLETPAHRALALAAIARASASSGQTAGLAELAEETLRLSATAGDEWQRTEVKGHIAEVFALLGQKPRAADLAREVLVDLAVLSRPAVQADVLASAVAILVMAGEASDAEEAMGCAQKAIEGISAAWDRAHVRAKIAQGLIRAGRYAVADTLIQEALDDMREVESADLSETEKEASRALALAELLQALAQRGRFERASELVQATRGKVWRAIAARTLAEALAERGEIAPALSTAELIEIGALQAQAWAAVIEAWMRAGALDQVPALLARAPERPGHDPDFAQMLSAWALALAPAQGQERALIIARHAAAEEVDDKQMRGWALADAAVALAEAGALDQALGLIGTLGDDDHPSALLRMIPAMARAGQLPRAAAEVARIRHPGWRTEVQQAIERQAAPASPQPARPLEADQAALAVWRDRFGDAFHRGRAKVFDVLREGAPLLVAIDQGHTLWNLYSAICEVETWW